MIIRRLNCSSVNRMLCGYCFTKMIICACRDMCYIFCRVSKTGIVLHFHMVLFILCTSFIVESEIAEQILLILKYAYMYVMSRKLWNKACLICWSRNHVLSCIHFIKCVSYHTKTAVYR